MNSALLEKDLTVQSCATFHVRHCQIITLTLTNWDLGLITESLQYQLTQAPDFFRKTAILLDFQMDDAQACDLDKMNMLVILLQHHELQILACTGPSWVRDLCHFFQISYLRAPFQQEAAEEEAVNSPKQAFSLSLAVRPGQQYARQGDLILLAPVHHGAEVLATGHIHAYARTQGRLLAGVNGDRQSQIFCTSLQAELIAIAGVFLTKDLYPKKLLNQSCRIYLSTGHDQLQFEQL